MFPTAADLMLLNCFRIPGLGHQTYLADPYQHADRNTRTTGVGDAPIVSSEPVAVASLPHVWVQWPTANGRAYDDDHNTEPSNLR